MTAARPPQIRKAKILICSHTHVSGVRCGSRSDDLGPKWRGKWFCRAHEGKFEKCQECYSMLRAFQPPGGWT